MKPPPSPICLEPVRTSGHAEPLFAKDMRVLVVEDQERIASFIGKGLKEQGFVVDVVRDGDEGYALALK